MENLQKNFFSYIQFCLFSSEYILSFAKVHVFVFLNLFYHWVRSLVEVYYSATDGVVHLNWVCVILLASKQTDWTIINRIGHQWAYEDVDKFSDQKCLLFLPICYFNSNIKRFTISNFAADYFNLKCIDSIKKC